MKKRTGRKVITVILVVIVCMFALFPFVWMISTSFKTAGEVYSKTPSFIPKAATMQGYKEMLTTHSTTFNFMQWLGNSVIVSLLTTAFSHDHRHTGAVMESQDSVFVEEDFYLILY